jgi:hypothetical protein
VNSYGEAKTAKLSTVFHYKPNVPNKI